MARKRKSTATLITVLAVVLAALLVLAIFLEIGRSPAAPTDPTPTVTDAPTAPPTDPPTEPPTEPPVIKEATASIGAMGDLLMHDGVRNSGKQSDGTFDFDYLFQYLTPYLSKLDYTVANLETTLCGLDNGYEYNGYPNFNAPDSIVDSAMTAGFDMLLTANNHMYDTRHKGFIRTQEVLVQKGMDYLGTRLTEDAPTYLVKDINGIKIGMLCYTYNTSQNDEGKISLNGIPLTTADSKLVNSFNSGKLDSFYAKVEKELEAMKNEGAEATVLFIHWGEEYQTSPNKTQKKIAQKLCDLGIDVIVGDHPHVVQPVTLLESTTDENHKTLCLYSTGNAVSNQRKTNVLKSGHTEDGVIFSFTFAKYSDGTVLVESTELIPTWVNMHTQNGQRRYDILPMDHATETWKDNLGISDSTLKLCQESYGRTMKLVADGLADANAYFSTNQAQVESEIGVQNNG